MWKGVLIFLRCIQNVKRKKDGHCVPQWSLPKLLHHTLETKPIWQIFLHSPYVTEIYVRAKARESTYWQRRSVFAWSEYEGDLRTEWEPDRRGCEGAQFISVNFKHVKLKRHSLLTIEWDLCLQIQGRVGAHRSESGRRTVKLRSRSCVLYPTTQRSITPSECGPMQSSVTLSHAIPERLRCCRPFLPLLSIYWFQAQYATQATLSSIPHSYTGFLQSIFTSSYFHESDPLFLARNAS